MAKFRGIVGYVETVESQTQPGVFEPVSTEKVYKGDVLRKSRRLETSEQLNDNINISNQISIVADEYAFKHFSSITYVEYMGSFWKVTDVEVNHPRLTLSIGNLYPREEVVENEGETNDTPGA